MYKYWEIVYKNNNYTLNCAYRYIEHSRYTAQSFKKFRDYIKATEK